MEQEGNRQKLQTLPNAIIDCAAVGSGAWRNMTCTIFCNVAGDYKVFDMYGNEALVSMLKGWEYCLEVKKITDTAGDKVASGALTIKF